MEIWRTILEFPDYSVSDYGRIRNDQHDRIMVLSRNQSGHVNIALTKGKQQYRRSVGQLVARAFVPHPPNYPNFDTPIHLDGDRGNNAAYNLLWRPRWFEYRYQQQFRTGHRGFDVPIVETHTGEEFETSWEAATKYGLIDRDIMQAIINNTYVWPTYQYFRVVE